MDTVEVETKRFDSDGGKAPEPQDQLDVEQAGAENQYDKLVKEVAELRKANEIRGSGCPRLNRRRRWVFRCRPEDAITKRIIFRFINETKDEKGCSVASACRTLGVSETGYYKRLRNKHKPKRWQHMLDEMHEVLKEHEENDNYGVERMRIAAGSQYISEDYRRCLGETGAIQSFD